MSWSDQRGTGRSEPRYCPGARARAARREPGHARCRRPRCARRRRAAYVACRREAEARGLDTRRFGTRITADDLELCAARSASRAGTSTASPMARRWR
jgi:hypothetical protein